MRELIKKFQVLNKRRKIKIAIIPESSSFKNLETANP